MNFSRGDFLNLRWSLLAFVFSLVVSGVAIVMAEAYKSASVRHYQHAAKQLNEAKQQLLGIQTDLENISTYASAYALLVEQKIVAGEQRLDWMEAMEKLRKLHYVIDFKYSIEPQRVFIPSPKLETGNLEIYLSGVNLQIELLHDMQLIALLQALRADKQGRFIIEHCTVQRHFSGDEESQPMGVAPAGQLAADCAGGWLTMKNKNLP